MPKIAWPEGKRFAFTVFDDTDLTSLENGPPVYDFLYEHGYRTTKSTWPIEGHEKPGIGGATCNDLAYREWVKKLQAQGFEIALHNVTYHTSRRETIIEGLDKFKYWFGSYPTTHTNHSDCRDNLYWGAERLTGVNKLVYHLCTRFRTRGNSLGHVSSSAQFWADLCRDRITYVRNFVFPEINTLKVCPYMPYHDPARPYVKHWFASSEGGKLDQFNSTICEKNQDRLEEEGGACIMYTHFGKGFCKDGKLNSEFERLMKRLSHKPGWFVPVSTLLDYLRAVQGDHRISSVQRFSLESRWLLHKLIRGGTS